MQPAKKSGCSLDDIYKKRKHIDYLSSEKKEKKSKLNHDNILTTLDESKQGESSKISVKDFVKLKIPGSYYQLSQDELLACMFEYHKIHGIDQTTLMNRREIALYHSVLPWFD